MSLQQSLADAEVELPIFFTGNITRHQPLHFGLQVRLAGPAKDHAILGAESMMVYFKNWTKGSRKNVCVSMAKKYALSEEVPALCCARVGASSCSRLTHARTTTSPQVMIRTLVDVVIVRSSGRVQSDHGSYDHVWTHVIVRPNTHSYDPPVYMNRTLPRMNRTLPHVNRINPM